MSLAIFDLDNTLIGGDSDHAWGEFLVDQHIVDAAWYEGENNRFALQYQQGDLDIREFLDFALAPLAAHSLEQLNLWHEQFMREKILPMQLNKAEALLQQHRQQGDYLLIITATNRFVTEPIATLLGVDDIIATEAEFDGERYTGAVSGTPCFQDGKVVRLQDWMSKHDMNLEDSCFYSDSYNDLPLLQVVERPVAVDPDPKLQAYAEAQDWEIISLR